MNLFLWASDIPLISSIKQSSRTIRPFVFTICSPYGSRADSVKVRGYA